MMTGTGGQEEGGQSLPNAPYLKSIAKMPSMVLFWEMRCSAAKLRYMQEN